MTHRHRFWHVWLWTALAPLLVAGYIAGLALRPSLTTTRSGETPLLVAPDEGRPP